MAAFLVSTKVGRIILFFIIWSFSLFVASIAINFNVNLHIQPIATTGKQLFSGDAFSIYNPNNVSLYDIDIDCAFGEIERHGPVAAPTPDWHIARWTYLKQVVSSKRTHVPVLDSNAKTSGKFCSFPRDVVYADIVFIASYRPKYSLFRRFGQFRFVSKSDVDGQMRWQAEQISY